MSLFISLCVTICVYTVPVIIYRFWIRAEPMEPRSAKKFTIIYAVIGFIIMSMIVAAASGNAASGGGVLLWSFVNYRILISGDSKGAQHDTVASGDDVAVISSDTEIVDQTESASPSFEEHKFFWEKSPASSVSSPPADSRQPPVVSAVFPVRIEPPSTTPQKPVGLYILGVVLVVIIFISSLLYISKMRYDAGQEDGYTTGFTAGYNDGYADGEKTGKYTGRNTGLEQGIKIGYARGVIDQLVDLGYITKAAEYAEENREYTYFLSSLEAHGRDSSSWR